MDVLVALGTTAAYFFSLYNVIAGDHHNLYFETSAFIITLILAGKYMEAVAKDKTTASIKALSQLQANRPGIKGWPGDRSAHRRSPN